MPHVHGGLQEAPVDVQVELKPGAVLHLLAELLAGLDRAVLLPGVAAAAGVTVLVVLETREPWNLLISSCEERTS